MNKLSKERRRQIVTALVGGNSLHATARMSGASVNTVFTAAMEAGLSDHASAISEIGDLLDRAILPKTA